MNRKKIALSVSTIALACALPVPALAEETAAPAAPVAVTAGLDINGENKTDTEKSSNLDSDAASSESTKQSEKAEETAQKGAEESVKTSVAASAGKSKQVVSAPQAVQAKAADATSSLPDITFGIGTYRDAGDDYMLDKVLYSYTVNASTPGVTVDGKYYVVPLQPIKDWLAANAPEYRLAGAIAGNSSVRVYASKNGKAIYEVEKDPNYKPADPKPAHTLIAKLGFRKADGTAVYSVDVYADDACVTRDGSQYWVSTKALHEWLGQHPEYKTDQVIPSSDSKGQCLPVNGSFPYSYLYEVSDAKPADPKPDKPTTPDSVKPNDDGTKKDEASKPAAPAPKANAEKDAKPATAGGKPVVKKSTLPQTGDNAGFIAAVTAIFGSLLAACGVRARRHMEE